MLQALEKFQSTQAGRAEARKRVTVEHSLAAVCNRNGPKARYAGCRKNEFNLNRAAIIVNLHKALQWCA
jgi:IS5 family transposase